MQTEIEQTTLTEEKIVQIAAKMVKIYLNSSKRFQEEQGVGPKYYSPWWGDLLDLVFDLLGVPEEISMSSDKWSKDGYCRDWAVELYCDMVREKGDIDGFVTTILQELKYQGVK